MTVMATRKRAAVRNGYRFKGITDIVPLLLLTTMTTDLASGANHRGSGRSPERTNPDTVTELQNNGWTLQLDNDAFNGSSRDRDYTGGLAFTRSGRRARDFPISANSMLEWFDAGLGVHQYGLAPRHQLSHALQLGLMAFTPSRLEARVPIMNDRPYANLLFMTNSRFSVNEDQSIAQQSHLTIGILGTPVAAWLQDGLHAIAGSTNPDGYDFQISDGGEPTVRYAVSRQRLLRQGIFAGKSFEVIHSIEAGLGFLTDVSLSIFARWGSISTPWWTFTPEPAAYIPQAKPADSARRRDRRTRERYLWAGATLRARAHNSFLQGQVRHSDVVFSRRQLEVLIPEFSVGFSTSAANRWRITYGIRYQGKEIRSGPAARSIVWAGIGIRRL